MPESKGIEQLLKEGLLKKGNDPSLQYSRLPIGIGAIDSILGGGLPTGRSLLLYGPESTGKTLLAQYFAATVQKQPIRSQVIYIDNEGTYDEEWWKQSSVNTDQLLVSRPVTAEETINMMVGLLHNLDTLGMFILDSVPGMVPAVIHNPDKGAEEHTIGALARAVTLMYQKLEHELVERNVILVTLNQMRANIGGYDELQALPGGKAQRHYSHIILRTARDSWIKEGEDKVGFYMEVESKKNKTCLVPDGTAITVPFLAAGQIDMLTAYIEDGIKKGMIVKAGPYFKWGGKSHLGKSALRQFLVENPEEAEELRKLV